MAKFVCKNKKGLKFPYNGKDFELKNGQEFEAEPGDYISYLLKNNFISEVKSALEAAPKPEVKSAASAVKPETKSKKS